MSPTPPPDWHRLSYVDGKLASAVLRLDSEAVSPAGVRDRVAEAWAECHVVRPDDLPDDDARAMLAKLRQWIETMGVLQSGQTEASAARQAERLIRDLAASVSAALERMEASR